MSKFSKMRIVHGESTEKADKVISEQIYDHINTTIDRINDCVTIDDVRARYVLLFGEATKDLFDPNNKEQITDNDILKSVGDTFKLNKNVHRVGIDNGISYAYNAKTYARIGRMADNGTWYKCDADGNYKFKKCVFQKLFYVIADPGFNTRTRYDNAQEQAAKIGGDFTEYLSCRPVKNSGSTEVTIN